MVGDLPLDSARFAGEPGGGWGLTTQLDWQPPVQKSWGSRHVSCQACCHGCPAGARSEETYRCRSAESKLTAARVQRTCLPGRVGKLAALGLGFTVGLAAVLAVDGAVPAKAAGAAARTVGARVSRSTGVVTAQEDGGSILDVGRHAAQLKARVAMATDPHRRMAGFLGQGRRRQWEKNEGRQPGQGQGVGRGLPNQRKRLHLDVHIRQMSEADDANNDDDGSTEGSRGLAPLMDSCKLSVAER